MKRIRPYVTQQTALTFYKSVIQSKFDYCSIIWGNGRMRDLEKLQKLQNRALRAVLQAEWRFPRHELFNILKIDNLSIRRDKHVLHIMYKIVHEMAPGDFMKYFVLRQFHYRLRNTNKILEIPKPHTNFKKRSLSYRGTKNWNRLPRDLKTMTFDGFKMHV